LREQIAAGNLPIWSQQSEQLTGFIREWRAKGLTTPGLSSLSWLAGEAAGALDVESS
jgi:hypothetical protein